MKNKKKDLIRLRSHSSQSVLLRNLQPHIYHQYHSSSSLSFAVCFEREFETWVSENCSLGTASATTTLPCACRWTLSAALQKPSWTFTDEVSIDCKGITHRYSCPYLTVAPHRFRRADSYPFGAYYGTPARVRHGGRAHHSPACRVPLFRLRLSLLSPVRAVCNFRGIDQLRHLQFDQPFQVPHPFHRETLGAPVVPWQRGPFCHGKWTNRLVRYGTRAVGQKSTHASPYSPRQL